MNLRVHVAPVSPIFPSVLVAALLGLSAGCASTLDGPARDWSVDRSGSSDVALQGLSEARFAQVMGNGGELDGRRDLSRKTVEFMLSQHTVGMGGTTIGTTGPGYGFGIGFGVRHDEGVDWTPGSKGDAVWAGAWGTSFWIDPKEKLVGILMAQGPSNALPEPAVVTAATTTSWPSPAKAGACAPRATHGAWWRRQCT